MFTLTEKRGLIGQLIKMALVDKKLMQEELAFINQVAKRMEIEQGEIYSMIKDPGSIVDSIPKNNTKRIVHFHKLMLMMHIDGHVDPKELQFLHEISLRYGFRKTVVDQLLDSMKKYPHGEIPPSELLTIHSVNSN